MNLQDYINDAVKKLTPETLSVLALCVIAVIIIVLFEKRKSKNKDFKKTSTKAAGSKRNVTVSRNGKTVQNGKKSGKSTKSEQIKKIRIELKELEKRRKAISKLPKSAQDAIPYKTEYDNGVFEIGQTKNGRKYSVCFAFEDINYETLKPEEAKIIFMRYVDILNGLPPESDVFLILQNQKMTEEELMGEVMIPDRADEYNKFRNIYNRIMAKKISAGSNKVKKERYFLVSIEAEHIIEAYTSFTRIENEIKRGFKSLGSVARRLSTMERLVMLHDIYRQKHIGELEKLDIKWEEIKKNYISLKDYICPDDFLFEKDYFKLDDLYGKVVFINDYPAILSDKFLGEMSDVGFTSIISMAIHPVKMDEGIKTIRKQILGMEANKMEAEKKAIKAGYSPDMINHNIKESLADADEMLQGVQKDNQKVFETSFLYLITGNSLEELEENCKSVQTITSKYLCQLRELPYQQEEALKQVLPFGHNILPIRRTLTTNSTAIFIPFFAKDLMQTKDEGKGRGFYYGENDISGNMIFFNRLYLKNANGFTLGASGSGKSFSAKEEMLAILLNTDDEVIVIDPDGEYVPFVVGFNGEHIVISANSDNYINPMDMDKDYNMDDDGKVGDPIRAKSDFIISLCEESLAQNDIGITPTQRTFIDNCVNIVYEEYVQSDYNKDYQPTFKELQKIFNKNAKYPDEKDIARAFELYSEGSLNVFSYKTNVDIKKRLVCYDISSLGKTLSTMGQLIMLDSVWNHVLENRKKGIRTWLYCDEFTVLLRKESSKLFFLDTFKRIRKMGGACTGITQNVTSLYRDDDAMEMLANSEFVYLLNQAPTDRIQLSNILQLSETELGYVSDSEKGCGILKAGRHIIPFKDEFPKDNVIYEMMTTDPEERKKIDEKAK